MINFPSVQELMLLLPGILIGLTFHEFAHGWVADRLGDSTARKQGRLTLNPLAHLDPVGFVMLILFRFGWAKPVPVNPFNLRGDPTRSMMLVSLAGPASNLLLAFILALLLGLGVAGLIPYGNLLIFYALQINVILALFNLIPVPPLDGSKILAGLLPGQAHFIYQLEKYGFIILIILLFTGVLGKVLWPAVNFMVKLFLIIAGVI